MLPRVGARFEPGIVYTKSINLCIAILAAIAVPIAIHGIVLYRSSSRC